MSGFGPLRGGRATENTGRKKLQSEKAAEQRKQRGIARGGFQKERRAGTCWLAPSVLSQEEQRARAGVLSWKGLGSGAA